MKRKLTIAALILFILLFCACAKNNSPKAVTLSEEAAQNIILQEIPGASASHIKLLRLDNDNDNGMLHYEGTIIYEDTKYEFEIDAYDGSILEWDVEPIYD